MASPFVYVPEASSSTPYGAPYYNQYYPPSQGGPSPFIPPSPLLYPSSPYLAPSDLPSGSPNAFNLNSVLWPEDVPQYESSYTSSWIPFTPRQRPRSWQGPAPALGSPFLQPQVPAFLQTQSTSYFKPGHTKKARSWGNAPAWLPEQFASAPQIHPWLNGDAPAQTFHFDLAPAAFVPLRAVSAAQSTRVSDGELRAPAFHPPRTALRILHPRLPWWPVDLTLPPGAAPAPIAVGDVLAALHHALQARIAPADWAELSVEDQQRVTRAFTHRCRAEAVRNGVPQAQLHDREVSVRNEGVKRVDFLLGKTVFKGLVRSPGDPEGVVRLVTA
ncbi:hypothetical protein B0H17DRAFT_1089016 [Mycena rosella]|uniref:DUF6699 domain-containing protein n=1 Tax=Mycena rosella TaxID=1033263 RepID=A0AAD7CWB1_MYCRO|nr:hypothetical protein B0H17DRAFT_1089016 [Mycena rosella]